MIAVCQCGLSNPRLPSLVLGTGQGTTSDQIMARNSALLAFYIGALSLVDSEYGINHGNVQPDSNLRQIVQSGLSAIEVAQATLAIDQSSHKGEDTMGECPR